MHLIKPGVAAPAASSTSGACNVKIHTAALFQILEIVAKQIISPEKRILGTLLGYRSEDGLEFEVRDAFMVPCDETGDSIAIEDHQHKILYQLYKKSHPKESVLGWFGTSNEIDNTTGLIHDFYSKGSDRAYPFPAIYLNIKFRDNEGNIISPEIKSYLGGSIGKKQELNKVGWKTVVPNNSYVFQPIPNEVITGTVTEKLSLNNLLNNKLSGKFDNNNEFKHDLSYLSQQINMIIELINKLLKKLETFEVNDENLELLRNLSNNLNNPSSLSDVEVLKKHFQDHNQDVIMIEYLTKVVKEQIELSARLTVSSDKSRD